MSHQVIELHFENTFKQTILELWQRVDSPMLQTGIQPHISLASFPAPSPEKLEFVMKALSEFSSVFELTFSSVGTFEGKEGVVFLSPAPTHKLLQIQTYCFELLNASGQDIPYYYHSNKWTPHCTISLNEPLERMTHIISECERSKVFGVAQVYEVALVEYHPAKTLFRFPLSGVA